MACAALAGSALAWAFACGPSVQFIYEGNIRFEHCYRLDLDESIAPLHRRTCWVEWAGLYSKGQTRDRLEYAKRRIHALDSGDGAALKLSLGDPADAGTLSPLEDPAPIPTNAHAPPPARIQAPAPTASANATELGRTEGDAGAAGAPNAPADADDEASETRRPRKKTKRGG